MFKNYRLYCFHILIAFLPVMGFSQNAIEELQNWLSQPENSREPISQTSFGKTALSSEEANSAWDLLLEHRTNQIQAAWQEEWDNKAFVDSSGKILKFEYRSYGPEPAAGRDLYISMHGGGNAGAATNDQQWQNQITLYQPNGIYLAPRAPTDTWNLWHEPHIDSFFDRVIEACVVYLGINPDRVYVMGYSAGGDGVYQLGPRMADRWAAAAMMAGHPNESSPHSLRNIGFTIHVGGLDDGYDRNIIAGEWGEWLDSLAEADPGGYIHEVQIHPDKPHWMDLEDAVALDWMDDFTRNPFPKKIVWHQDDRIHQRFYWLEVPENVEAGENQNVIAEISGQSIHILQSDLESLKIWLNDSLLNLDENVEIYWLGNKVFSGKLSRNTQNLWEALNYRGDRKSNFNASITVSEEPIEIAPKDKISANFFWQQFKNTVKITPYQKTAGLEVELFTPQGKPLKRFSPKHNETFYIDLEEGTKVQILTIRQNGKLLWQKTFFNFT